MATDVVMPQMGESIAEGTIVRWIKKVGDTVDRDEPLFEISTDKVDAEIPSPAAGVLTEIKVKEGETVPVNSVVAVIGAPGRRRRPRGPRRRRRRAATPPAAAGSARRAPATAAAPQRRAAARRPPTPRAAGRAAARARDRGRAAPRSKSSPLVRQIAKEHNVDIAQIHGTGIGGRVTKDDILGFIEQRRAAPAAPAAPAAAAAPATAPARRRSSRASASRSCRCRVMRKKIAEHMVLSAHTSAHVHSVFEVNFARVAQLREHEEGGVRARRREADLHCRSSSRRRSTRCAQFPIVNASIDGDNIVYKKDINLGIAVALD